MNEPAKANTEDILAVEASLRRMGLMPVGAPIAIAPIAGGVSCDVWHVTADGRQIVVKRALPKLRVTTDWRAPAERAGTEVDWFQHVSGIDQRRVPEILGEDRPHHIFAMEYLPPETYPLWKTQLAAGKADAAFAAEVGGALAHI